MTTTTQPDGSLRIHNTGRDPQPIYSINDYDRHQPKGRTRRLYALETMDVWPTGTMLLTFRRVRRERRSGSWVFTNRGCFHTTGSGELRDVRFVAVVG